MVAAGEARTTEGKALMLGLVMAVMVVTALLSARPAQAAVFTVDRVTNESDASLSNPLCDANRIQTGAQCTLRAAIEQSNATAGADVINFNIPGTGVQTIAPGIPLPAIEDAVTIDGYSQPGTSKNTLTKGTNAVLLIELSGANAGEGAIGLDIQAPSLVTGLVINRFDELVEGRPSGIRSGGEGIRIASPNSKVEGNFIGTDPSGTIDLGNEAEGIEIFGGEANTIGGTSPDKRNLISGNDGDGVQASTSDSKVEGNLIGTGKDGVDPLGNSGIGVRVLGTSGNTIGGATAGAANTIAFNGGDGVKIDVGEDDTFGTGNRISRNSIFANVGIGIDLLRSTIEGDDGRTANDPPPDADTGANNLQNYPVITSATTTDVKTTVAGKLKTVPGTTFKIQFFSNPSGNEGKRFLGQKNVTTGTDGLATFAFEPAQRVAVGQAITATATDPEGSTSEFSTPRSVVRQ